MFCYITQIKKINGLDFEFVVRFKEEHFKRARATTISY